MAVGVRVAPRTQDTDIEVLAARVDEERERRAELTATGDWRDAEVPVTEEPWLFPGEDGVPPTGEQYNDAWHVVRDAVGWTKTIPYRNLRHHAVLWWKAKLPRTDDEDPVDWDTIADWSGHDVRTLQAYYVVPSEQATKRARGRLDQL
jgi:integrase